MSIDDIDYMITTAAVFIGETSHIHRLLLQYLAAAAAKLYLAICRPPGIFLENIFKYQNDHKYKLGGAILAQ